MLRWLRGTMGGSAAGMNAMFGALEEFFNPAAARARKDLEEQHERVIPIPSPGDKLLAGGKVVIPRTPKTQRDTAQPATGQSPEEQPLQEPPPTIHLKTD
jgi:hypothetical protein